MPGSGNQGFTGIVQSGSGNSYQVLLNNGQTVAVTQMQIDPSETIPVGTPVIVIQVGTVYFMQCPVFLTG